VGKSRLYHNEILILKDPELRKKIVKSSEKVVPQGFSENYYGKPIPEWVKIRLCLRK
jgi:hypothetical protein